MDKITEALKKLLPEEQVKDVAEAVSAMLEDSKKGLEEEYNAKLEDAYAQLSKELKDAETTATQGYEEAYGIVTDLRNRLEMQREEFEQALEEGYEEAYQMLIEERKKNEGLEVGMYEEYDGKLGEMKEYIVDKVDQFLQLKGKEIYDSAHKDAVTDPRFAEHKVAVDKIANIVGDYLTDEELACAATSRLDDAQKSLDELKGHKKILEAKLMKIEGDNKRLNEAFTQAKRVITEHQHNAVENEDQKVLREQKERAERAKGTEGKGTIHDGPVEIIAEYDDRDRANEEEEDTNILESVGVDLEQLAVLAGTSTKS